MKTRSKARTADRPSPLATKPKSKQPSPDWDIQPGDFSESATPKCDTPTGTTEKDPSPFVPSPSTSPSRAPTPDSPTHAVNELGADDPVSARHEVQASNARSPRWLAWQDRLLIQEAERHRPFNAPRGDASRQAWESLAVQLLKDSSTNGSPVNRTGAACRARFQKLIKAHNADQTRSLQKTGTDEEVDEHIELLTQVVELVHAHELEKDERSAASRKKADVEAQTALELRDAAMQGIVPRNALTDVTQLEGASVREKQGQRAHKRRYEDTSNSDKENSDSDEHKPKRRRNPLTDLVKERNASDAKRLDKAREADERRHEETKHLQERTLGLQENLVVGLGELAKGINTLVRSQAQLAAAEAKRVEADNNCRIDEAERRREDAERRAAEAERHATLLQALSGSRNN
ncbi:hypothetical protein C8R43DRAFT_1124173 [Mycena crocata]|nr:hypothetical protein C8R43DRAFT_1124173 [Mycena crocata]